MQVNCTVPGTSIDVNHHIRLGIPFRISNSNRNNSTSKNTNSSQVHQPIVSIPSHNPSHNPMSISSPRLRTSLDTGDQVAPSINFVLHNNSLKLTSQTLNTQMKDSSHRQKNQPIDTIEEQDLDESLQATLFSQLSNSRHITRANIPSDKLIFQIVATIPTSSNPNGFQITANNINVTDKFISIKEPNGFTDETWNSISHNGPLYIKFYKKNKKFYYTININRTLFWNEYKA